MLSRYTSQINLFPNKQADQKKIENSSCCIIGMGGTGCNVALELVQIGIGNICIVDDDRVSISNLSRQFLFNEDDIGEYKCSIAIKKLEYLNKNSNIKAVKKKLTIDNVFSIIKNYDFVIDCTDNIKSKVIINDACVFLNKTFLYISAIGYKAQVGSWDIGDFCIRCIFGIFSPSSIPHQSCQEHGVIYPILPLASSLTVNNLINKIVYGEFLLKNTLLLADISKNQLDLVNAKEQLVDHCKICKGNISIDSIKIMHTYKYDIDYKRLQSIVANNKNGAFILSVCNIDEPKPHFVDRVIPLSELEQNICYLPKNKKIVIMCTGGVRSKIALGILKKHGFLDYCHLEGGFLKYFNIL